VELHQLLGAGAVARELERLAPPDRSARRWPARWTIAAGAAAAALVALAVVPPLVRDAGVDRLRDHPGVARGIVARPASPRGEVTGRPPFHWSSVPEASGYRSIETPDTTATLGSEAELVRGVSYWWRVEARVDFDRWVASDLANFSLR
jgi:hypothetical protein